MRSALRGFLIDSNVLVYAHDPGDKAKQHRSIEVLDRLVGQGLAVLSVQCLSEFFSAVTRRIPYPLRDEVALAQVERLARSCQMLDVTPVTVLEACRGAIQHQMSYWDAQIWAVAHLNGVAWIITEDGQHSRLVEGVRYMNPFLADFDLGLLGSDA